MQLHQMQSQVYYKQERIYAPDTNDFLEYRNWEEISQFIEQANNYHAIVMLNLQSNLRLLRETVSPMLIDS